MRKISQLSAWLNRTDPLDSFIDLDKRLPNQELGGFLSLDVVVRAHESLDLEAESLAVSWERVHEYVGACLQIIQADVPVSLDCEEVEMIKSALGEPPALCYPLYLISVGDDENERLVYIGKTSSTNSRFKGGHTAFTKLLHPKYDGLPKQLYLGAIVLLSDDKSYQPLEWVKPLEKAYELLNSIEAQLIFEFKPELNNHHVQYDNATWPVGLHIQNFTGVTSFLNDHVCFPGEWGRHT